MTHAHTPTLAVIDPRGLAVRAVAYHRRNADDAPDVRITHQAHDAAGRLIQCRDPRQFQRFQNNPGAAANQSTVFTLLGAALLSENSDAGWRLGLPGAAGQRLQGWDQKHSQSRVVYDEQLRTRAIFEHGKGEPERRTACFAYDGATAEAAEHNRCGRLIRHDDTAGTQHFSEYSLMGAPLDHSRQFIAEPHWRVDWPAVEAERDLLLEPEHATTRIRCNAAGELFSQTDTQGNRQIFSQTCAGELREVRLKLQDVTDEQSLLSELRYNAFGQVERQRAANDVVSCATYRPEDGRLVSLKAQASGKAPLQDLTYDYDPVGNILAISDAAQQSRYLRNQRTAAVNRYRYDSLYQLIEACGRQIRNAASGPALPGFQSPVDTSQLENYHQTYDYDASGNLEVLRHCADSGNRTERSAIATFSNRSLPFTADGEPPGEDTIRDGYDLNGNLKTLQPGQHLSWDLHNQLRQVDQVVREDEPDDNECYLYDDHGQRLRKIRTTSTARLTHTHETRYLPGLEIRTGPKETLHVITVQAGRCTVQVLHWKSGRQTGIAQNQHRYTFSDHLGSSTLELDDKAELISQESYYPYGGTAWWAGRDKVEASYKTIRYSGKERDATGLYYYGHRYYVPWRQRWLSADPAGTADGLNLYAMVHANPIGHVDLTGLAATGWQTAAAATATFVRDTWSTAWGGIARYALSAGITSLATAPTDDPDIRNVNPGANITVTALGALSGAAAWGAMGAGAGTNIAARYTHNRRVQQASAIAGGSVGMVAGATPSIIAYLLNPEALNLVAISILTAPFGNTAREANQRVLAELGPRIELPPSGRATLARTVAYTGLLAARGGAQPRALGCR